MKKSDILVHVAAKTSLSKANAAGAVDAVLDAISDALARGESVSIAGFGNLPSFKAGKGLRDAVG